MAAEFLLTTSAKALALDSLPKAKGSEAESPVEAPVEAPLPTVDPVDDESTTD